MNGSHARLLHAQNSLSHVQEVNFKQVETKQYKKP